MCKYLLGYDNSRILHELQGFYVGNICRQAGKERVAIVHKEDNVEPMDFANTTYKRLIPEYWETPVLRPPNDLMRGKKGIYVHCQRCLFLPRLLKCPDG